VGRKKISYHSVRNRLDLGVRRHTTAESSLYGRIAANAESHPEKPMRYEGLPMVSAGEECYYPGARDLVAPSPDEREGWLTIIAAVLAAGRNKLDDWRVLEHNIKSVPFIDQVDKVLANLDVDAIGYNVRSLFRDLVLHGSDYNAIKWGILISARREISVGGVDELLLMARHAELTLPVCYVLSRRSGWYPHLYRRIPELLPMTDGWGSLQVIRFIISDPELWGDPQVRRDTIISGMRNSAYARTAIAFEIASHGSFLQLLENSAGDEPLAVALLELIDAITYGQEQNNTLAELKNGERIIDAYLRFIERLPHSIELLTSLRGIFFTLDDETIVWDDREILQERSHSLLLERLARETLVDAIRSGHHRNTALALVREAELTEMAGVVLEVFRAEPTPFVVEVLGSIGNEKHLRELYRQLPDFREAMDRTLLPHDTPLTPELYMHSLLYASIVRHIGRLETPGAIRRIKLAARDFHPQVRAAAMIAMQCLMRWTLDAECKALVLACIEDADATVSELAQATANYHMLHASLNREGKGVLAQQEMGMN
jgi:hypothetical protein